MKVSIIVPILNEEQNIPLLYNEIEKYCPVNFELIFIDDGSTDNSFLEIFALSQLHASVKCLSLSRNFGHQNSIMAGLEHATGESIIIMDGDLQHPPALIPTMLTKLEEGFDIVNTKRLDTKNISSLKKWSSKTFYSFINSISDTKMEMGVTDFKAFNRKVLGSILQFKEKDLFLRGIFSWIGFKSCSMAFEAPERMHGTTKYSLSKMWSLALRGTTSFSFKPLRIAVIVGSIISLAAFTFAIFALFAYFKGETVQGWASTIIALMLLGGTQLLAIGFLGEYIASLFTETKKRPLYLINKKINME